jgi:hypothetical protein
MTIEEMNKTEFTAGMKVNYKGETQDLISVNFEEHLIGIGNAEDVDSEIDWVRCENVSLEVKNERY